MQRQSKPASCLQPWPNKLGSISNGQIPIFFSQLVCPACLPSSICRLLHSPVCLSLFLTGFLQALTLISSRCPYRCPHRPKSRTNRAMLRPSPTPALPPPPLQPQPRRCTGDFQGLEDAHCGVMAGFVAGGVGGDK